MLSRFILNRTPGPSDPEEQQQYSLSKKKRTTLNFWAFFPLLSVLQ